MFQRENGMCKGGALIFGLLVSLLLNSPILIICQMQSNHSGSVRKFACFTLAKLRQFGEMIHY
jgi:hypothetical protein